MRSFDLPSHLPSHVSPPLSPPLSPHVSPSLLSPPLLSPPSLFSHHSNTPIACFHCGLPVPSEAQLSVKFKGHDQAVCCVGCEAVATTIIDAGLSNFYVERSGPSALPALIAPLGAVNAANYDLPRIQSQYVSAATDSKHSASLYIDGVTCNACLWLAEATLRQIHGVVGAEINYISHRAELSWQGNDVNLAMIVDAVARVGLRATPVATGERQAVRAKDRRESLKHLGVALLAMMQVMMFTVPLYFTDFDDISAEARRLMQWASLALTLPVVFYAAQPFWLGALRDWRTRHISMDSPVALAIATTFTTSLWAMMTGRGALYFDSISMFVFLLLMARYLEASIRDRALTRIERLSNSMPAVAWQLAHYPVSRASSQMASAGLAQGDAILIPTGQTIPADCILLEGLAEVDESIVTGESRPVIHAVGSTLIGGTINLGSPLIARVECVGAASVLATVARMAERSLGERPRLSVLTDRVARLLMPSLIGLAAAAGIIWLFIDMTQSFSVAVAVIVVTCPCAVALAAPLAYASATLKTAKAGLLISRGHVLEMLPQITDVVFDKTGTLTTGKLCVGQIDTCTAISRCDAIAIAAALEVGATHPIAESIRSLDRGEAAAVVATNLRVVPGGGVEGEINGSRYRFGHQKFSCPGSAASAALTSAADDDAFVLSCDEQWLATFQADDALKPDALATVSAMQRAGRTVHLLSGDRIGRVRSVADELGIDVAHTLAEQTPAEKLAYITQLRSEGRKVAMIGDGVNDAPVLGAADVSIAMAAGADLPRLTADAVLMSPKLSLIISVLTLARRTKKIINQNFAWAILYNAIAIPLAMANLINPAWAAIGMGVSGLIVVLNSMRLLRSRTP